MGTKKYEKSIKYQHYWKSCNNFNNFVSYYNQLNEIYNTNPKSVLEIGIGNKLVYNHLKEIGVKVTSLDINEKLKPDVIGDIRKLPFLDNSFDTVVAFEVLEHIPFSDFEKSLTELRVSKKWIIISIPYSRWKYFEFYLNLPIIKEIYLHLSCPIFFKRKIKEDDCHYWEFNERGYSKKKILNIVKKHFLIKKQFRPRFNKYHLFLILEKTK